MTILTGIQGVSLERNRVLRNTYWLLALSLVPTVLGAWLGVASGASKELSGAGVSIAFLIGSMAFMWAIMKFKNSGVGVALLLAFTFFMGLMLSRMVGSVLGLSNGGTLVMLAFGGTGMIFVGMASLATVIKRDLSGMGKFLFVGLLVMLVAGIANIFLHSSALMLTLMVASIGIFSAYMLYDIKQVIDGGEANYVVATLQIYLDLYNVFQSLLGLLGIGFGEKD